MAICGPTGVGKTKLSIELAKKYNAIVVNADAVQVYQELNIGSAKPTEEEKCGIPHYLFGYKSIKDNYTVKDYQTDLRNILTEHKHENIIIVGGTGLYLSAGLYDYEFNPEEDNLDYENLSNEKLYNLALKKNPKLEIHPNNRIRLIRYLKRNKEPHHNPKLLYDVIFIGLTLDRKDLYELINLRVDKMIANGLEQEVKDLLPLKAESRVLNTAIGYKELINYLEGNISKEEAITTIKKNSRHYAKRQYTWFNNKMKINWFSVDLKDFSKTVQKIEDFLANTCYNDNRE